MIVQMEDEMDKAVAEMRFEDAANLRDQIEDMEKQVVSL